MPELPEIETICRGISQALIQQQIKTVIIRNYKLRWPIAKDLETTLIGQQIHQIKRRGKYILVTTQTGTLIIHLGMSGNLQIKPAKHAPAKHEHATIIFTNGLALCYNDPRRFGAIVWTKDKPSQHVLLKNLGPEPLERNFNAEYLFNRAKRCQTTIKQFIMDNKIVVGVGNIYANEALFAAKINPWQKANTITLKRYKLLGKKIREILRYAIESGGTTIKDYSDSKGKKGSFQYQLKVYGKQTHNCLNCKTKLQLSRIGQRATVFCPHCQQ